MARRIAMRAWTAAVLAVSAMAAGPVRSEQPPVLEPAPPAVDHVPAPPPVPRPGMKTPKRGAFPFKPWSYVRAYTYNFFGMQPVQMRILTDEGSWSRHIRSEQPIGEAEARRAAALVAETTGSIETTKCTFPRHAIVYFDGADKPVASVDVCFDCEAVLARPDYEKSGSYDWEGAAKRFEAALPKWRKLFEGDLGLPIDYRSR